MERKSHYVPPRHDIIDPHASWRTIFYKDSGGFSSKRICGVIGWGICLILLIAGFIMEREIPDFGDLIAVTSASLLGVDCITSIFQKTVNKSTGLNLE